MTEQFVPPYTSTPLAEETTAAVPAIAAGSGTPHDQFSGDDSSDTASTKDVAKDQAAQVGQGAVQAGQHVGAVAKDQAANVTAEAGKQAQDLLHQARTELTEQAGQQQQRLAAGLRSLGEELHSMSQHNENPGVATDLARQASSKSSELASWLDDREPGTLLEDVKTFARQRPAAFLLLAAGAGLLGGRLTRSLKEAAPDGDSSAAGSSTPRTEPPVITRPYASSQDGGVGFGVDAQHRAAGGTS